MHKYGFGRVFLKRIKENLWLVKTKNPLKKKDTKKEVFGFLTLKEKEHRFYEIRWHRGWKLVLIWIESFYFNRRKICKKFMFKI